jgi:Sulfate permease family
MWRGDRRRWLRADLIAALSLWVVLVPQGLAYGELTGLAPVAGLYTALGAMVAYGLLGTSRYLNLGPESSVAILVASSLAPLARLGVVTRLLSAPVLTGYLAGSAIVIIVFPGCPTPAWTTRCGCSAPPPASPCWSSRAASAPDLARPRAMIPAAPATKVTERRSRSPGRRWRPGATRRRPAGRR